MTFRDTNGNELLFDGDFAMTKQSVSIFNGSIKGDVSITFTVDNNSVNREILNYSGPKMLNQVAFTRQPFTRISKGNIIDQGYIVIQSEDDESLKCFYVSGNSNWMQSLEELITELDYSGKTNGRNYVKNFSFSNITSSSSDGITFPFIDWCFGRKKGNNDYFESSYFTTWRDIDNDIYKPLIQSYPCFYVQSLVNEIFNQNGIKKDGNIFTDQLYKSLALPPVDGMMKRQPFKKVILNGSSQTYSAGVGTYEKIKGLSLRQGDSTTWDDVNKRFITPIQCSTYAYITMTSGTANRVIIYKNGTSQVVPVVGFIDIILGIRKKVRMHDYFPQTTAPGDYFELYTTNSAGSPFTAAFDIEYEIPEMICLTDYINPGDFLPGLKSIDVIKFLINFFGCSVYFDSTSKSITITIIEKLKLVDAYDWSEFYVSHRSRFTDNAAHNFINWENSSDTFIAKYNQTNTLKFADGDIETDNDLLDQKPISKLPFAPSSSSVCFNGVYCMDLPLINLVDEGDPILFTAIASITSDTSRFTTGIQSVLNDYEVVRITNGNGENIGYYMVVAGGGGATYEDITFPFLSTDTGKIWRQKISYQKVEPRIITVKPSTTVTNFSKSVLKVFSSTTLSTLDYAAFTKNFTGLPIDQWKNNLAIDNPNTGNFTDPTIKELYLNKISRFIKNPKIEAVMTLPESVYQRFKFDQFIYLKTEKLTGYFFVDQIINYVDSNTPVEVTLFML